MDAGYGTGALAADVLEMGVLPHMPPQASPAPEAFPTWKRPTRDLAQYRRRREKVRIARQGIVYVTCSRRAATP